MLSPAALAALLAIILTALPLLGAQNTGYPGFWLYGDEYDTSHSGQQDVVSLLVDTVPACALLGPFSCTDGTSITARRHVARYLTPQVLSCVGLATPLARQPDQGSLPGHGAGVALPLRRDHLR